MKEIWKRLVYQGNDYGDFYLISSTGEIKGVKTGKIRKKNINQEGYYFVSGSLGSRDKKITFKIHKAVAETFILNINNYPQVNHKDGNKLNNDISNLEWCTNQQNITHAVYNGLLTFEHKTKKIKNVTTGIVYESIKEAAEVYNKENYLRALKNISNALCGYSNKAYGCMWEYIA